MASNHQDNALQPRPSPTQPTAFEILRGAGADRRWNTTGFFMGINWHDATTNPRNFALEGVSDEVRHQNACAMHVAAAAIRLGGHSVQVQEPDIMPHVAAHGTVRDGACALLVPGRQNDCHGNCDEMAANDSSMTAWTGICLSSLGKWNSHSWCVRDDGVLIETTAPRLAYYGVSMDQLREPLPRQVDIMPTEVSRHLLDLIDEANDWQPI